MIPFYEVCLWYKFSVRLRKKVKRQIYMEKGENSKIQNDILKVMKNKNECELGYLVSHLNYSYDQILQNVLELKQKGKISKVVGNKGCFSLR